MCTLVSGFHFQKSPSALRLSTQMIYVRSKYDHGGCRLRKIAICRVPNRSWNYKNYEVVAIFDKLVVLVTDSMVRPWILLKNQFLYTDEYCDAIGYEGLVFAATTRGTVFAWHPSCFGTFVFHCNYNCFIHMHAG